MLLRKLKTDQDELDLQFNLIKLEYKTVTSPVELTRLLNHTFETTYSVQEIITYMDSLKPTEDFELESRKHQYGYNT